MSRWLELMDPTFHNNDDVLKRHPFLPPLPLDYEIDFVLDLVTQKPDTITDLIRLERTPFSYSYYSHRRLLHPPRSLLEELSDRVSSLEARFDRVKLGDRKYTWTAEIKGEPERHYKWIAEIKSGSEKKKEEEAERKYKWSAEIEGSGGRAGTKYTIEVQTGGYGAELKKKEEKKVDKKKKKSGTRIVEIEDPHPDHAPLLLRQAFAKRVGSVRKSKGKMKELSAQDAALLIQMSFRAYLIRRSQTLRALRELAIAKAKLKELRALFNNFSYRRQIARDGEERQRFSEKIIVLLLTVDAIEGADIMVRAAKRSMVDELEAMLDVVDPQPTGKLASMRRRTFDMPDGTVRKEIAAGVAQVVQMLDHDASTFETTM